MANILDGMDGGKHNSDNTENIDNTPSFKVTLTFEDIDAKDPLSVTKQVLKWIQDGADKMIYDVENELTGDKFTVDLSEEDEDAVVPNNE